MMKFSVRSVVSTAKRSFHHGDTEDTEKIVVVHREIPLQILPFSSSVRSVPPCCSFFSTASVRCAAVMMVLALAMLALAGCGKATPAPAPTPTPAVPLLDDDEAAIRWLLGAESRGVVNKDMDLLAAIWAEDAVVIDAKHTPDDPADDARWQGVDAVLDRYVTLVFPGNPTVAAPVDVQIVVDGDRAEATSTTRINDELSPGGDKWTFVKRDGRWFIQSLTYNLEPGGG